MSSQRLSSTMAHEHGWGQRVNAGGEPYLINESPTHGRTGPQPLPWSAGKSITTAPGDSPGAIGYVANGYVATAASSYHLGNQPQRWAAHNGYAATAATSCHLGNQPQRWAACDGYVATAATSYHLGNQPQREQ